MQEIKKGIQEQQKSKKSNSDENKHFITKRTSNSHVEKIYVDDEQYYGWNRFVSSHRKKAQRCGECLCPKRKLWQCDADCEKCPFFNKDKLDSLDSSKYGGGENADSDETVGDYIEDPNSSKYEQDIIMQITLESLIVELNEKEPELALMLSTLYKEIKNNKFTNLLALSQKMSISTSTFYHRVERLKKILKKNDFKNN